MAKQPELDEVFARIKALVIRRTLHHYYEDKDALLRDRVLRRMNAAGLDARNYLALLEGKAGRAGGDAEWTALEADITINETFFFRFAEQFAALANTILPTLIQARADSRRMRIWSAGCSTGAEPYSVAILLHRLLGDQLADWSISILGTDISESALAAARAAEYGDWALRSLPDAERRRDFIPVTGPRGARWQLRPAYQRMVRFERQNLLELLGAGASPVGGDYDLVLCRNVLIYFHLDQVRALVRRFGESLAPDGWLLLGHAEAAAFELAGLRPVTLDGTVVWMRADTHADPAAAPARPVPPPAQRAAIPAPRPHRPPPVLFSRPAPDRTENEEAVGRVQAMADAGEPEAAWRLCRDEIERHPLCAPLFFYAALLGRALGRDTEAEADFRRAIYLCKQFVMAHYHLGLLLTECGEPGSGRRSIAEAGRIAGTLADDAPLPYGDGMTAGRLRRLARLDWLGDAMPSP